MINFKTIVDKEVFVMNLNKIMKKFNNFFKSIFLSNRFLETKNRSKQPIRQDEGENAVATFFDGMGSATATEIIKRRIDKHIINKYGIQELTNTGRYYTAQVTEVNGSIIHTFLIDKQNGMVRSLYRKAANMDRT